MSAQAWRNMGAVPFEDPEFAEAIKAEEAATTTDTTPVAE